MAVEGDSIFVLRNGITNDCLMILRLPDQ